MESAILSSFSWSEKRQAGQKLEVAEEARRSIEQQFDLINPMFLGQTRWGYIFDNRSPDGLLRLTQAFGVDKLTFIDGNPPALTGPTIVRMAGPFAVQSFVSLGLGLLIIFGSYAPAASWRRAYLLLACGLLSSSWYLCQLPISSSNEIHFWMGDFGTYTDSRAAFDTYFSMENSVRFHFHLSRPILYWLDRALGSTATSPQQALLVLSWLAGCAFIAGVMVVARNERAHSHLKDQFKQRLTDKHYTALVLGKVAEPYGTINFPIARSSTRSRMAARPLSQAGKEAITHYEVIQRFTSSTLLDISIETGRTHQIRAHVFALGHPVAGDKLYLRRDLKPLKIDRLFLHASKLGITLPNGERQTFVAPLPDELTQALTILKPLRL